MPEENLGLTYTDEFGETCHASFKTNEYHSLMELLCDKYMQDWGDCKGRAWCGTCHIKIHTEYSSGKMDISEMNTLSNILDSDKTSRLACQIPLNSDLNGVVFSILER
ncbi:ferredoxin [Zobellia amurskyensis]|uniref:Ferredoxin n=1 Tax=Zobellia amurskyensis TaxID=248905 RepID=A0A7X2ZQ46_9FLAO|nr:2Fe-2S iron-sulfur cluster-binding protein [Zobellia amurskyensis]MUH34329.1 ferredoxin [Zobellia amurskyensis]